MAEISSRPSLPDWLRIGSHIRVRRGVIFMYYHHGIYYGRRRVIHYSGLSANLIAKGQGKIEVTPLEMFRGESEIELVAQPPPDSIDQIIHRARVKTWRGQIFRFLEQL